MGKKSKRNRSKTNNTTSNEEPTPNLPPSLRPKEEETKDNLHFEDPFEDEFEEEDILEEELPDDDAMDATDAKIESWTPFDTPAESTELEITPEAYKLHFALTNEWPCLSFDFLADDLGYNRTRFPHSLLAVIGTQADKDDKNKLTVLKLSDLSRMQREEDDEGEEDSEDSDEEDLDETETDPTLEYYSMKHDGTVNRIRALPPSSEGDAEDRPQIVACWGSKGVVSLYNISNLIYKFDVGSGKTPPNSSGPTDRPFFVYRGHSEEGYAMDWNKKKYGTLATGDCAGDIHIWDLETSTQNFQYDQNAFGVERYYHSDYSVEDLQWSPSETTVFASAECHGTIKIYDTRCKGKPMLSALAQTNHKDVNVIAWNHNVSNLLASGSDDGVFSVWDLRTFSTTPLKPLARFHPHTSPITSLEWHPTDESMIVVSDEDNTYIYDLSVEEDEGEASAKNNLPPQMLFMHCGSRFTKEVHWHPQITSLVMGTAQNGLSVFIPSNL